MIIDVNAWFGSLPYWELRHNDPDSLVRQLDRAGIDRAFACSLRGMFQHDGAGNEETLAACARHPDRLWPTLTFNPHRLEPFTCKEELERAPVRMVRLSPVNHSYQIGEEPRLDELADHCGREGIPILLTHRLMTNQRVPNYPLAAYGAFIAAHPGATFIISTVNYLYELQATMHIMRRNPNAWVETSGMMGLEAIEKIEAEMGVDRVLHGSCAILQMPPEVGPLRVNSSRLSQQQKRAILSGNAIRLLGLDTARIRPAAGGT